MACSAATVRADDRAPHAWLPDGRSTLDLIDPRVPTILVMAGVEPPNSGDLAAVGIVPHDVWCTSLGLDDDQCLILRPDQHIA